METRTQQYADRLAQMIRIPTVSVKGQEDRSVFYQFHHLLRSLFPGLFRACEFEDLNGSFLLRWKGISQDAPILLMSHHDVVEAGGSWTYPPFAGRITEDKLWGRGALDTKGSLFAMLQAAEELIDRGFQPRRDVYFFSACTEESDGSGADRMSLRLQQRGIRFAFVLDEGGMILPEPIGGAKGDFAMVGLGEKGCADLKFIARSGGGHASTPGKNTPLVRLGKFMAAAEKKPLFQAKIPQPIQGMFRSVAATMGFPMKGILGHPRLFAPILVHVIPKVSETAGAMLRTTLAFTMAQGSDGSNVLPQEAWVIGNMRFSHHQGRESSVEAVRKLAAKYDVEVEVLDPGFSSPISSPDSDGFRLVERAVGKVFPGTHVSPYLMTGASDCRFMSRVSDNCIRFAPFKICHEQMASIHGIDENVDLSALVPAVDFYQYILEEA